VWRISEVSKWGPKNREEEITGGTGPLFTPKPSNGRPNGNKKFLKRWTKKKVTIKVIATAGDPI